MDKEKIGILVIDRPLKEGEKAIQDIFNVYGGEAEGEYNMIVIPLTDETDCTEVLLFSRTLLDHGLMDLFSVECDWEEKDTFGDFDLEEIEADTFYEMLAQKFEVTTTNLSTIKP